ncbi:MAG: hypothetical protein WC384_02270 [Prolixibacteraceae bacterium]|jgi:hypothetical protein
MNKVLFKETQQFRQWWSVVLMLASTVPVLIFSIYAFIQQVFRGIQVGDNPAPNVVLVSLFFFMLVFIWGFFSMKLEVEINEEGIHYRFFPLIRNVKMISKGEIQRFEIRKYKPILDYGGWGVKRKFKWGRAYNVSGNIGLQLYLTNGKKVLFGTQRSQAIKYAMDEVIKRKQ